MPSVIRVNDVSFSYPIYRHPRDIFIEAISGRNRHEEFWALRNVSVEVHESERLGVIGHNGSGKSTLLKILTGVLRPSSGSVSISGRVSAMLGFNASLNPEESGLSNIRLNLLLNGHSKSKIASLTEEIVEFTELGSFIYSPVKTYSSGMNAKLAFAISTAVEPGVLIIDEVLSVGDSHFVGKATKRMLELCDKGQALVFVSHSMQAMQMLCNRVLWLDKGEVRMLGSVNDVVAEYEADYRRNEDQATRSGNASRAAALRDRPSNNGADPRFQLLRIVSSSGTSRITDTHFISNVRFISDQAVTIPLELVEPLLESLPVPHLDVLDSEWGRIITKSNREARTLSAQSSRLTGGRILLPTNMFPSGKEHATLRFSHQSINHSERLMVQYFHRGSASWRNLPIVAEVADKHGWKDTTVELSLEISPHDSDQLDLTPTLLTHRPDAEIDSMVITVGGQNRNRLKMDEAFCINVIVAPNTALGDVDVGVKITRKDGVVVFWQSSGRAGTRVNLDGAQVKVSFEIPSNLLAPGEFDVTAWISSPWDFPRNYPYSIVYDRAVSGTTFGVENTMPGLDFGVLSGSVDVSVVVLEDR